MPGRCFRAHQTRRTGSGDRVRRGVHRSRALYLLPRWTAAASGGAWHRDRGRDPFCRSVRRVCADRVEANRPRTPRSPRRDTLFTQWSPVNRVDLCRQANPKYSWWAFVGRSKKFTGTTPEVLDIQYDGHNGSNIYHMRTALVGHAANSPAPHAVPLETEASGPGDRRRRRNRRHQRGLAGSHARHRRRVAADHGRLLKGPLLEDWTGGIFKQPKVELVASEEGIMSAHTMIATTSCRSRPPTPFRPNRRGPM